ncbi:NUDIX hydrolase [Streptomyces sp. NRRL B-24085]|uniref:NUDIX hydrolase n=1 Tax=Streptomyces sp. NRRL B-24085 TaxID=1709476 RepID=UPI0006B3703C|nr:NUDIX hydrolase [Streptomyces sp. NRRL B-24085]
MRAKLRVAAYAVCVRDGQVLLARWIDHGRPRWTLPGGGMEHGEDPYDTVLREVAEETGHRVEVTGVLGVRSARFPERRRFGRTVEAHHVGLLYEARVTGGELRFEVGGSTDTAAWHDLDAVPELERVPLVDFGLRLWQERPVTGRPGG